MVKKHHDGESYEAEERVGTVVCLELANTASSRREGPFAERLHSYEDLVDWAEKTGVLDPTGAAHLRAWAAADPAAAAKALSATRELREAIYRVFVGRSDGTPVSPSDLELIARRNADAVAHRRLVPAGDGFRFVWPTPPSALEQPLWVAAVSAAELAVSDQVTRVKECATSNCNWLFLDASRNRSRRWCEMSECGNRAKARRHYQKKRGQAG